MLLPLYKLLGHNGGLQVAYKLSKGKHYFCSVDGAVHQLDDNLTRLASIHIRHNLYSV